MQLRSSYQGNVIAHYNGCQVSSGSSTAVQHPLPCALRWPWFPAHKAVCRLRTVQCIECMTCQSAVVIVVQRVACMVRSVQGVWCAVRSVHTT